MTGRLRARLNSLGRASLPIVVVAIAGLALTGAAFREVSDWARQKTETAFTEAAQDRVLVIHREFQHALAIVQDIAGFFNASPRVGRREFRKFVGPVIERYSGIQALAWAPWVGAEQREDFVAEAKRSFSRFQIRSYQGAANRSDTTVPREYLPVLYVQPYQNNKSLLGYDLLSSAGWPTALERARNSRELQISPPIPLGGESESPQGFVIRIPVYQKEEPGEGDESAEDQDIERPAGRPATPLRGMAIGIFRVGEVVERALRNLALGGIHLAFFDVTEPDDPQFLYRHVSRWHQESLRKPRPDASGGQENLEFDEILEIGDRRWKVVCTSVPGRFRVHPWSGWIILVGGFSFTVLLTIYLFSLLDRARKVQRLVSDRTEQLEKAVGALNHEIRERSHAEEALQRLNETLEQRIAARTAEAEKRAGELEQFAYVISHDLKAPLRAISNLAGWLQEDLADKLTEETREQMALLRDRVKRMQALIEGLLDYARVGRVALAIGIVDTGKLVGEIIDSLAPPPNITIEIDPDMPVFSTDGLQLGQVFANLIGNSIKHRKASPGHLRIGVQELAEFFEFSVADDGPGIAPQYHDKIFEMFQALEAQDRGGDTGIGLALVKKIVQEYGGCIRLESTEGEGACFRFTWPKRIRRQGSGEMAQEQ